MWKTILRRVLLMIPQLFILSILVFILAKLMPGDALSGMAADPNIDPAVLEQIRIESGFYDPWYVQYAHWVRDIVVYHDFGKSIAFGGLCRQRQ